MSKSTNILLILVLLGICASSLLWRCGTRQVSQGSPTPAQNPQLEKEFSDWDGVSDFSEDFVVEDLP